MDYMSGPIFLLLFVELFYKILFETYIKRIKRL